MLDGALAAHAAFDRAAADPAPVEELANVRRLNNLLTAAWKHGFASKPPLDAGRIVERAIQAEHGPLASGEWETGLRLLSHDLQDHARLNPLGRTIAHGLLVRILRQRIRATALWQGHRDIASIPIQRPIILMGHMRSGTTRLHRLLSCDPRFSCTRTHENLQPVRRNHAAAIVQTSALLGVMNLCNPRLAQIHPVRASDAEEEYGLHAFS